MEIALLEQRKKENIFKLKWDLFPSCCLFWSLLVREKLHSELVIRILSPSLLKETLKHQQLLDLPLWHHSHFFFQNIVAPGKEQASEEKSSFPCKIMKIRKRATKTLCSEFWEYQNSYWGSLGRCFWKESYLWLTYRHVVTPSSTEMLMLALAVFSYLLCIVAFWNIMLPQILQALP